MGVNSTNHSVVISTPEEAVGIKSSELLLVALASCISVDAVEILTKERFRLAGLEITATGEQESTPPWTFRKIHQIYRTGTDGLTSKVVEQAIQLSEEKYCSVASTIQGVAEITTSCELLPEKKRSFIG